LQGERRNERGVLLGSQHDHRSIPLIECTQVRHRVLKKKKTEGPVKEEKVENFGNGKSLGTDEGKDN